MFGFGKSKKSVEKKFDSVQRKIDPSNARDDMSLSQMNDMGMAAMKYDAVKNEYGNSKQRRSDRRRALSSLKSIEKDARKASK